MGRDSALASSIEASHRLWPWQVPVATLGVVAAGSTRQLICAPLADTLSDHNWDYLTTSVKRNHPGTSSGDLPSHRRSIRSPSELGREHCHGAIKPLS